MPSPNQRLRDKILRERGLVTTKGKLLVKAAPQSEINTATARLCESYFGGLTLRQIYQNYSISEVARQTGIHRSTLHRWKIILGI